MIPNTIDSRYSFKLPPAVCVVFFFFNDTATTEIYTSLHTLSLHDALPITFPAAATSEDLAMLLADDKGATLIVAVGTRSEEHTSELQSRNDISYAVFC